MISSFMNILFTVICLILLLFFPDIALSEIIVHDTVAPKGQESMLTVETKGKLFREGGELVEFFVDGKSLGKSLSGGDGFAFKRFVPSRTGIHRITVKSKREEGQGLLLSLRKGDGILFVDVEGSLFEGGFSETPKKGSQETIRKLSGRFQLIFLQTGALSIKAIKVWLKKNGFTDLPVIAWENGMIFDEIKEHGFKIKAVIGSGPVIESAKAYHPRAISFDDEVEGAVEVKSWEEIGRRLTQARNLTYPGSKRNN